MPGKKYSATSRFLSVSGNDSPINTTGTFPLNLTIPGATAGMSGRIDFAVRGQVDGFAGVPEPGTVALGGLGLLAVLVFGGVRYGKKPTCSGVNRLTNFWNVISGCF
jgi:hypothetical protein